MMVAWTRDSDFSVPYLITNKKNLLVPNLTQLTFIFFPVAD